MAEAMPSGSGGPIQITGPATDGGLEIRGGIGGIAVQFEELTRGAEKLDELADELASIEVEVNRVWKDLGPYQNDARASGTGALQSVGEAQWSVQAVREELRGISSQVRASTRDYETAEAWASLARGIGGGLTSTETLRRQAGDLALSPFPNREVTEIAIGPLAMFALLAASRERFFIAFGAGFVAGKHAPMAVPLLAGVAGQSNHNVQPRPVTALRKETMPIEFDGSPAALLERVRVTGQRGEGYIEVIEVDNGGKKAYVVVIPGTQSGGELGGANPFDEAGIAEGLGHNSTHINKAVMQALRESGAEKGSPVVAAGYSQGGIHAVNLAADELFLNEYDMTYVLTAGSPVGGVAPAAGVNTLHLEHRQDWVPGADATPNPDSRNRVTVTMNHPVRTPEGEGLGIGPGHRIDTYLDGARLVSASEDPSLAASTEVLGGVLGAGGTATATRFALSRSKSVQPATALGSVPTPAPQLSPQPSPQPQPQPSPSPQPQPQPSEPDRQVSTGSKYAERR